MDNLRTGQQCRSLVNAARDSISISAHALNNPVAFQYAQSLDIFANQDQANIAHYINGVVTMDYRGGCSLLENPDTREYLWPTAREKLRDELSRLHTGVLLSDLGGASRPTLHCQTDEANLWRCT